MITERKKNDVKRKCLDVLECELKAKRKELKQLRKGSQFSDVSSETISLKLEEVVILEDVITSIKKFLKL